MSDNEVRPIRPHRSGGGAPFMNAAEQLSWLQWAREAPTHVLRRAASVRFPTREESCRRIVASDEIRRRAARSLAPQEPK